MNRGVLAGLGRNTAASGYGPIALRPLSGPFIGWIYYASDVKGGTPYRWNGSTYDKVGQDASGQELDYATSASNFTTASTTPVDYTGLTISPVVGTRPIVLEAELPWVNQTSATGIAYLFIVEGSTVVGSDVVTLVNGGWGFLHARVRLGGATQPSAGGHTYKVQVQTSAGSITSYSTALQAGIIPYLQAVEC